MGDYEMVLIESYWDDDIGRLVDIYWNQQYGREGVCRGKVMVYDEWLDEFDPDAHDYTPPESRTVHPTGPADGESDSDADQRESDPAESDRSDGRSAATNESA